MSGVVIFSGTDFASSGIPTEITGLIVPYLQAIDNASEFYEGEFSTYVHLEIVTAESLKSIGNYAFSGCTALTTVTAEILESIGDYAFNGTNLTTINAESLKSIGEDAFSSTPLTTMTAKNLEHIGDNAFNGCTSLTTIDCTNIITIGNSAFFGCKTNIIVSTMASPIFTHTDSSYPLYGFVGTIQFNTQQTENDVNMLKANYPNAIKWTFWTQNDLTVTITGTTIEAGHGIPTDVTKLIANNLESIGKSAFYPGYTALTTVIAPELTSIGESGFDGCIKLKTVTFESLKSIGMYGFYDCDALITVTAPNLTSMGDNAFSDCAALKTVTVKKLESIGYEAFSYCSSLITVTAENLKNVGESAFYDCTELKTVTVPVLTSTSDYAFSGCTALTTVTVPALTSIGTETFSGCTALTTVTAGKLEIIGARAFDGCSANIIVSDMTSPIFTTQSALDGFVGKIEFKTHQDETELSQLRTEVTDVTTWINPPLSVSHSGGDPYVYPVVGPCYKLPNCEEVYRLYQDAHVVVNARVSVASPQIQAEIVDAVLAIGCDFLTPVSTEAYFYSHVVIVSRTTNDQVLIDLEQKQHSVTGSTQMFRVGSPELLTDSRPYESTVKSHVGIPVRWGNDMCLTISFSRNPQVRNGVRLSGTFSTEAAGGLLVRNYRPKLFRLPDIHCTSFVSIPTRCTRPLTKRGIQGHRMLTLVT